MTSQIVTNAGARARSLAVLVDVRRALGFHADRCDALRPPAFGFIHDCSCDLPGLWQPDARPRPAG